MMIPRLGSALLAVALLAGAARGVECTDAELLALEISGELLAPPSMVAAIESDLAAIRAENPYLSKIHVWPDWMPGQLLLKLTEDGYAAYQAGEYHDLDELNSTYKLTQMRHLFQTWFAMEFAEAYNPEVLGGLYAGIESVLFAEPDHLVGDGDDIRATEVGRYLFRHAWGDCPAGCISEHVWVYTVGGSVVQLVVEYGDEFTAPGDVSSWSGLKSRFREPN